MEIKSKASTSNAEMHVKKIQTKDTSKLPPHKSPNAPSTGDKVVLSPKAQQIEEAQRLLKASPEIREETVARIRNAIETGTYRVEGARVASKMTKDALLNEVLLDKTEEE